MAAQLQDVEVELVGDVRTRLGEGPLWDAANERLLFVDTIGETFGAARREDGDGWSIESWPAGEQLGVAIPRAGGGLVLAGRSGFVLRGADGELERTIGLPDGGEIRVNDAKADPLGRIWAGTLHLQLEPGAGALFRLDPDLTVHRLLGDIHLANGLDWSPDGCTFYFVDSMTRRIDAFDCDLDLGEIGGRRPFAELADGVPGFFDGMCVDDEGCVWAAAPIAGRIHRYAPDGELLGELDPGAIEVTSCAFGGADRGDLFVTTSSELAVPRLFERFGWDPSIPERAAAEPARGALRVCRPGVTGPPAFTFAG